MIEVIGDVHGQQVDYDAARDRALAARGLRVLRFCNAEVAHGLPGVLRRIAAACQAQAEI